MSQAALLKLLPKNINPAQVRAALTKVLMRQFAGEQNFNSGWLVIGLNGPQSSISEKNITNGNIYLCCSIFLALGLDRDEEFWRAPDAEWSSVKAWNGGHAQADQSINF